MPVALKKGENRLFVVDATAGWKLELWKPPTRCVVGTWDVGWPHVTGEVEDIRYPVFNASVEVAQFLHIHYGHVFVPNEKCHPMLTDWRDGGQVAPLALLVRAHYLDSFDECTLSPGRASNCSPLCVYAADDVEAAREMLCDLDASYERKRLTPALRGIERERLATRPQGRIPPEFKDRWGMAKDVVVVCGTLGSPEEDAALLARARLDQQVLW